MQRLTPALIKQLPKIDLHCHLDGSVSLQQVQRNLALLSEPLPETILKKLIVAPQQCENLTEYLQCFEMLKRSLSNQQLILLGVLDICRQASEEHLVYLELRFSPYHLSSEQFSMEEVVLAVIEAVQQAQQHYPVKVGIILCMMRSRSLQINQQVLQLSLKYRAAICGVDLAGNEQKYPTKLYQILLNEVVQAGLPLTVHAGETGNPDNIRDAVQQGAKRIGHGIAAMQDEQLIQLLATKGVTLELCPVCNVQTRASHSWAAYPFATFFKEQQLHVTINTDNRTVSNTSLTREFLTLQEHFGLTVEEMKQLTLNSLAASFTSEQEKQRLARQITDAYQAV